MLMAGGYTVGYIREKKLTKHVCQLGKSSLRTGILPGFRLLSTSLVYYFMDALLFSKSFYTCYKILHHKTPRNLNPITVTGFRFHYNSRH